MRHTLLALLFLWTLAAAAVPVPIQESALQDPTPIAIGIVTDNEPYSSYNAHGPEGFSIDVLDEVSRLSGLRFDYRVGSWPDIYGAFLRGEIDAVDEISWREDRAGRMLFTRPYHMRHTVVMHDANRPLGPVRTLADLKGRRIGILRDVYYADALRQAGLDLAEYNLQSELAQALSFGWVDAIIGSEITLSYFARLKGFANLEVLAPAPLGGQESEDFRIAVPPDRPELHRILDNALARLDPRWIEATRQRWQEYGGRSLNTPHFQLNASEQALLRQQGPVRIGLMRDYAPLSFEDGGQIQGLTIDVLSRIQDLTGLRAIPVSGQWSQLIALFERGEIDVMANISDLPSRRSFSRFTDPYHYVSVVGFTRSPQFRLESADNLDGLKVGYGAGIFYEDELRERLGDDAIAFDDQASMLLALKEGRVDLVLAALAIGNHWIRELELADVYVAGELVLDGVVREDLRFALRPGLEPLVPVFDRAMRAITPTEMRVIENRWLGAQIKAPDARTTPELSEAEMGYLAQRGGRLSVCVHDAWMPIEGLDANGQHQGLAASLLTLLGQQANLQFEPRRMADWPTAVAAVRSGACDLLAAAPQGLRESRGLAFTQPYYSMPTVVLARLEAPFITSLAELGDRPIGVSNDANLLAMLRVRHPGLVLQTVPSEADGLRQVQSGDLYGYIGTLATSSQALQEQRLADVRVIGRVPMDTALALATAESNPVLTGLLDKLLASVSRDDLGRLKNDWNTVKLDQRVDYTVLWQVLPLVALALLLLFLWNRKLRGLNLRLAEANRKLEAASTTDALTGLGNRARFDQEFEALYRLCARHRVPFLVAMIDADHFKQINDRWGHNAGDICLQRLASLMRGHFKRLEDHVIRFGGEEFIIFAPVTGPGNIPDKLDHLREDIEQSTFSFQGQEIRMTVSIGYCLGVPQVHGSPQAWLQTADRALYEAKRDGRNRVVREITPG